MKWKYYVCSHCGNIITKVKDGGVPVVCCGQKMEELVPGTDETSGKKHNPVYERKDGKVFVKIGEIEHPMAEKHFIEWIALETTSGTQTKYLNPGDAPEACFSLCEGEEVKAVYEHCNLHGLWKS